MGILNVFFIHYTDMRERDVVINSFRAVLSKHSPSNFTLGKVSNIESFNPNAIELPLIQKTVSYAPLENDSPYKKYNSLIKNLHVFQLSNTLKHLKVLDVVSQLDEDCLNLVLEDDISYDQDRVMKLLEDAVAKYKKGSIMFLGLPNNAQVGQNTTRVEVAETRKLFELLPYNDSYLIDTSAAKKLYENFLPVKFATNIQFSHVLEKTGVESYQTIPNIFVDGSKLGMFTSSLNVNNVLIFNNDYMKLREIVNKEKVSDDDRKIAFELCVKSPCAPHPDFQYLKALFECKLGAFEQALKSFENAKEMYSRNMCIMNHESQFLKDFMRTYKYMQN